MQPKLLKEVRIPRPVRKRMVQAVAVLPDLQGGAAPAQSHKVADAVVRLYQPWRQECEGSG